MELNHKMALVLGMQCNVINNICEVCKIDVCWNDAFRRIFSFHRWESVAVLQMFCGDLSFEHIYRLYRWNFLCNLSDIGRSPVSNRYLHCCLAYGRKALDQFSNAYANAGLSVSKRKSAVYLLFQKQCEDRL